MQRNITVSSDDFDIIQPIFEVIWKEFLNFKNQPKFPQYYVIEKWAKKGTRFNDWEMNEEIGNPTLFFHTYQYGKFTEHPYPFSANDAALFAIGWLKNLSSSDFPEPYCGDGSNVEGFWFSTNNLYKFGHPQLVIRPAWIYYGK